MRQAAHYKYLREWLGIVKQFYELGSVDGVDPNFEPGE
jgi:hypothetical protein